MCGALGSKSKSPLAGVAHLLQKQGSLLPLHIMQALCAQTAKALPLIVSTSSSHLKSRSASPVLRSVSDSFRAFRSSFLSSKRELGLRSSEGFHSKALPSLLPAICSASLVQAPEPFLKFQRGDYRFASTMGEHAVQTQAQRLQGSSVTSSAGLPCKILGSNEQQVP